MAEDDEALGGSPRLQGTWTREGNSIRLVKGSAGELEAGSAVVRARPRPEREGLMRAECAVIALQDGLRTKDLDEKREWFLFARSAMHESIRLIEADLDRLTSCPFGPWRVAEEKLKRMFEEREREKSLQRARDWQARKVWRTSGPSADGLDGRSA